MKQRPRIFRNAIVINPRRSTRRPDRLMLDYCPQTTLHQRNCYNESIMIFNKLPNNFEALPINQMCNKLEKWLLGKCLYSVKDFLEKWFYNTVIAHIKNSYFDNVILNLSFSTIGKHQLSTTTALLILTCLKSST